jgi:tRNA methyltransferase complex GCD14 subunit
MQMLRLLWLSMSGNTTSRVRDRLRLMSNLLDPSSEFHLLRLGITTGWHCLEIGGGNGSLSQWLARRVGPDGHVIASDIRPDLMQGIAGGNLEVCKFEQFIQWATNHQIDYYVGRKIPAWLQAEAMLDINSEGHAIVYNGGSGFAEWWDYGIREIADKLQIEGGVSQATLDEFFTLCRDPTHWTITIAFTATTAQRSSVCSEGDESSSSETRPQ